MTKTEMLEALAEICVKQKIDLYCGCEDFNVEDYYKVLSTCDDLSTEIEYIKEDVFDDVSLRIVEHPGRPEDNDEIQVIFEFIKNNKSSYLRFTGRYSSWDSSYYYEVAEVFPRERTTVEYVTKTKLKD